MLAEKGVVPLRQRVDEFMGKCGACRCFHGVPARLRIAIADIVQGRCGKNLGVLRNHANVASQHLQVHIAQIHATQRDAALAHVVEALQQLKDGGLAGAAAAHQRNGFSWQQAQVEVAQRGWHGARGIGEAYARELDRKVCGPRHGGPGWCGKRGACCEQFHQPLHRTRGAQQVAIDLAQHGYGTREKHRIENGLPQLPGRQRPCKDRLGPEIQPPQQQRGAGNDDEGHQRCTGAAAAQGCTQRTLRSRREAGGLARFCGVALHHGNGAQHLCGDGAGICHAVLACA